LHHVTIILAQRLAKADAEMKAIRMDERKMWHQNFRDEKGEEGWQKHIPVIHPNSRFSMAWQMAMVFFRFFT